MKQIKFFIIGFLSIVLCSSFGSCKSEDSDIDGSKVSAIVLKEAKFVGTEMQLTLKNNQTLQLTPIILPTGAIKQEVIYSNEDPGILEVSKSGLITPKAVGRDILTVSATDGSEVSVSYVVVISDYKVKATAINLTEAGSNIILKKGGATFDLGACITFSPEDTWDKTVTYKSNDESIVTVSPEGIITPVGTGSTTITITTADGSNISRDCNVTVQDIVIKEVDINRSGWTVTTQTATNYGYVVDGTTGLPEHLFDNIGTTFLSLVKPNKSYNPVPTQPASFMPSFTVDMKSSQTFNYIKWQHRSGNNYNYLRVFGINIEGSNDGLSFTPINTTGIVWIPNKAGYVGSVSTADTDIYRIDIPDSAYRYVKVILAIWSDIYSGQHPDYPGNGATGGSTMQIGEFGLGKIIIE